jgi:integrase
MPVYLVKPRKGGSRYWRFYYYINNPSERVYGCTKRTDRRLAQRIADQAFKEAVEEHDGVAAPKALREAAKRELVTHLDDFLRSLEVAGAVSKYVRARERQLLRIFAECGWSLPRDLRRDAFESWRARQTFGPKTLNDYRDALRSFAEWMVKMERVDRNPFAGVSIVSTAGKETRLRRAFTPDELARLVRVSGQRAVTYLTAAFTGLRRGELQQVRWSDVDLAASVPVITARASTTKNGKEARIPVRPEVVKALQDIRPANCGPSDRVFKGLVPRMPRFKADLEAAGIPYVDATGRTADFHALRVTLCTELQKNGVAPRTAMEAMRHSDIKLTMKTYTDAGQLPVAQALHSLPGLPNLPQNTPQDLVPKCPNASFGVQTNAPLGSAETLDNEGKVTLCPTVSQNGNGARCRVRTCDPCRVKAVLYR